MSQAGIISTTSGPVPPAVATTYDADIGSATPAANILEILADSDFADNDDGIITTGSGNTITVVLTNRVVVSTTTSDNTPLQINVVLNGLKGTYLFTCYVVAYNQTDQTGASFTLTATINSTGAATTVINTVDKISNIQGTAGTWDATVAAGAGDSIDITVTGLAGKTIVWKSLTTYTFVNGT